jgi:hypothetical protein
MRFWSNLQEKAYMINKTRTIAGIAFIGLLIVMINFANNTLDNNTISIVKIERPQTKHSFVPTKEAFNKHVAYKNTHRVPFVEKDFVGFKEALAFKESQGRYSLVNTLGYMGKYQFGKTTLRGLKVNPKNFLKDPILQEKTFVAYLEYNKYILRKEIKRFDGKWIAGIKITESGILAAAHLGGAGAVQKFLWSAGSNVMKDAYGTSVRHYLKKFSGYDLSNITARRNPIVKK